MRKKQRSFQSKLVLKNTWPRLPDLGDEVVFIYDRLLLKKSSAFKKWIAPAKLQYPVTAGETLKDVQNFPHHIIRIAALTQNTSARHLVICVIGGGSVGDFGGFVASVLKRGVRLIHIPSTWLAAIDSAHGGKTALNVEKAKNQIGTFYPAEQIFLIKDLLLCQPAERAFEGFGELLKVALLNGGSFWKKFSKEKNLDSELLWKYLPEAINAKLKIVAADPEERSGHRHLLNFGHTAGHIFESAYKIPHGVAINYGLGFALRWSAHRGDLNRKEEDRLVQAPLMGYLLSATRDQMSPTSLKSKTEFRRLLLSDKKKTNSSTVRFIFLQKPGNPLIQEVTADDILKELERQRLEDLRES